MLENIQTRKIVNIEKKLADKLIKEYSENVNGNELIYNRKGM